MYISKTLYLGACLCFWCSQACRELTWGWGGQWGEDMASCHSFITLNNQEEVMESFSLRVTWWDSSVSKIPPLRWGLSGDPEERHANTKQWTKADSESRNGDRKAVPWKNREGRNYYTFKTPSCYVGFFPPQLDCKFLEDKYCTFWVCVSHGASHACTRWVLSVCPFSRLTHFHVCGACHVCCEC